MEVFWSAALTAAVYLVLVGRPTAGDPFPPLRLWLIALGVGAVVMLGLSGWPAISCAVSAPFFWGL